MMLPRFSLAFCALLLAVAVRAQTDSTTAPPPTKHTKSSLSLTLQATAESKSEDANEVFSAVWIAGLEAKLHSERGDDQIDLFTRMRYGQQHSKEAPPQKTEDDLIV